MDNYKNIMLIRIIGFAAALLTTMAFFPQARKTWKSRSTGDHSTLMYFLFCTGLTMWLLYGILKRDAPIIVANIVTLTLAGSIMYFILKGRNTVSVAHIAIFVRDLEKMKLFYQEQFGGVGGIKYRNSAMDFTSYFITFSSGCRLELMHLEKHPDLENTLNWGHIAISLGSKQNVIRKTKQMKELGFDIISGPRTTGDGYFEAIVADPEGNRVELTI